MGAPCKRCNGTGVEYYYDTPQPCETCSGDKINANWKPPTDADDPVAGGMDHYGSLE